jgi:hypothetical protein
MRAKGGIQYSEVPKLHLSRAEYWIIRLRR